MMLDATLAYLHFAAILAVAGLLVAEAALLFGDLGPRTSRRCRGPTSGTSTSPARARDRLARVFFGAKGVDFYAGNPAFWTKRSRLFLAVGLVSIKPTIAFIRWRRAARDAAGYTVPDAEIRGARRFVLVELHLLALLPLAAVLMARGIGH